MINEAYGKEPTNSATHGANRGDMEGGGDVADPAPQVDAANWLEDKREVLTEMGESLAAQGEALAARGRGLRARARDSISSHPWQAVMAAISAGYLLARLSRR